ncbi:trifunctional dihydropteroate synthetase [Peltigera leucophlebia]|nr:trifunctional dihydropteroate synthetase [Peltigera leucophlebia]
MESETERKESTTELDVFHDEPHNPILNAEESSFFNSDSLVPSSAMPPAGSAYRHLDTIYLHNLELSVVFGPDAWNRPDRPQPIILSLQLQIDNTSAGNVDDIRNTFSYSQICKDVMAKLDSKTFMSIDHLTSELAGLADNWPGEALKMQAMAPKAMLRVEGGFGREFSLKRIETKTHGFKTLNWHVGSHEWVIKGLKLACIIGVNHHEQLEKQNISIDIRIQGEAEVADYSLQIKGGFETWRQLVKRTCDVVEPSTFQTLEALAALIAKTALESFPVPQITVRIEKPSAITFAQGAGVEITRDRRWMRNMRIESSAVNQLDSR